VAIQDVLSCGDIILPHACSRVVQPSPDFNCAHCVKTHTHIFGEILIKISKANQSSRLGRQSVCRRRSSTLNIWHVHRWKFSSAVNCLCSQLYVQFVQLHSTGQWQKALSVSQWKKDSGKRNCGCVSKISLHSHCELTSEHEQDELSSLFLFFFFCVDFDNFQFFASKLNIRRLPFVTRPLLERPRCRSTLTRFRTITAWERKMNDGHDRHTVVPETSKNKGKETVLASRRTLYKARKGAKVTRKKMYSVCFGMRCAK
jgi:hypothetical protein